MKRYKLTQKGEDILDAIKYVFLTGICALILMYEVIVLGIYILSIMGYVFGG